MLSSPVQRKRIYKRFVQHVVQTKRYCSANNNNKDHVRIVEVIIILLFYYFI